MEYGLIGERLGHSFSKLIHEELCSYSYELCPLPDEKQLVNFMENRIFKAINVTIPYKEKVIPFCATIDSMAKEIGSVNTIVNENGILKGYNTDFAGLSYMINRANVSVSGKKVLLLGTGGTYKTALAVCRSMGAKQILTASRTKRDGILTYDEALKQSDVEIIINTSPVGMYPQNDDTPIDINAFSNLYAVLDVVYNPLETRLVSAARQRGLLYANGLSMLVAQAVYAARLFTRLDIPESEIERVLNSLYNKQASLVLVGMPSCGKSSMGKAASKLLHKPFVDIDELIEKEEGMSITQIFAEKGEEYFRILEQKIIKRECAKGSLVVSTGGGSVLRKENVLAMRQNGIVVYIKRSVEKLSVGGGRPLSKSPAALKEMLRERGSLYEGAAHKIIENNSDFDCAVSALVEAFNEAISN